MRSIRRRHQVSLPLRQRTQSEKAERSGHGESGQLETQSQRIIEAGHVANMNAQAAFQQSGCSIHLCDALGGDVGLPAVLLRLPGSRLRQPVGCLGALVEGLELGRHSLVALRASAECMVRPKRETVALKERDAVLQCQVPGAAAKAARVGDYNELRIVDIVSPCGVQDLPDRILVD